MSGKLGMKRTYWKLYCRNGHRRRAETINVRFSGEIRCLLCERSNKKKCRYGLGNPELDKIFDAQGRCCAACGSPTTKTHGWHTDHSHRTEKFRGILCDACNRALGCVKDSLEKLQALIDYLNRTEYANSDAHNPGQH